jgi:transcriptional regulator with XRE-family HTH domain
MGASSSETSDLLLTAGAAIRSFRIGKHLTQSQVAAKANLSLRALAKLERGEGSSLETFVRALQALDASHVIEAMAPRPRISPLALMKSSRVPQRVRQSRPAS